MADETITGQLLREQRIKTNELIKANNLSKAEQALLEGQALILKFLEVDHNKIAEMYPEFIERSIAQKRTITQRDAIILMIISIVLSGVSGYLFNLI